MMRVKVYLAPSSIEGLGVFAAEPVAKGTMTWAFDPPVDTSLTPEEAARLPAFMRPHIDRYAYLDERHGVYVLCGDAAMYMNHSDDPNVEEAWPEGHPYGVDVAARDIAAGEEFLCDYRSFDREAAEKMALERRKVG